MHSAHKYSIWAHKASTEAGMDGYISQNGGEDHNTALEYSSKGNHEEAARVHAQLVKSHKDMQNSLNDQTSDYGEEFEDRHHHQQIQEHKRAEFYQNIARHEHSKLAIKKRNKLALSQYDFE